MENESADVQGQLQDLEALCPGLLFRFVQKSDGAFWVSQTNPAGSNPADQAATQTQGSLEVLLEWIAPAGHPAFLKALQTAGYHQRPLDWKGSASPKKSGEPYIRITGRPRLLPEGDLLWTSLLTEVPQPSHLRQPAGIKEKLDKTNQLLRGVNEAAGCLLQDSDYTQAIQKALALIGQSADADRVYIFENHQDQAGIHYLSQKFEWVKEQVLVQIDNPELQNLPYGAGGLARWQTDLSQKKIIKGLIQDFPESEKALLEPQDILSILVAPIFIEDYFWGFIGFDDCTSPKVWSEAEENILLNLAFSIGGAISSYHKKQELQRAKEVAEQAALAKSEFLSSISHELRTPLHAVIGVAHLLLHGNPRHEQIEHLKVLKFSSEGLLDIINDLLDYNQMEASQLTLEEGPFLLQNLISQVQQHFAPKAETKGLILKLHLDPDLPAVVVGDQDRVRQIMSILVDNAIKFTQKGRVVMEARLERQAADSLILNFLVSDTGIGISPDRLPYIFDSFTHGTAPTGPGYGGTGLGLAIAQKLLQLLGSQINVESEEGKGSRFSFSLQLKPVPAPLATQLPEEVLTETKSLMGCRVLLVEDNRLNQFLAKQFLKRWDVQTDIAENGKEALELLRQQNYHLVLMDLLMPEMDGFEATLAIRQLPDPIYQSLPIVALTASATEEFRERSFAVGMNDFITKPFLPDVLYLIVEKYARPRLLKKQEE